MSAAGSDAIPRSRSATARAMPIATDAWFTLELVAARARITVVINGSTVADYTATASPLRHGIIALHQAQSGGEVRFRKIEIKHLPR
jgi:hypothetical protein